MTSPKKMSSSSSSSRVGEIFSAAGMAFNQLGELTTQLSSAQHKPGGGSGSAAKWTDEEVQMLHQAVTRFAQDLNGISERIKDRTVGQIKTALKKKAYEEAGLPLSAENALQGQPSGQPGSLLSPKPSADVTLNMLNAPESEVDVEGLGDSGRLDFGATSVHS